MLSKGKPPIISISFLGSNVIKCQKYCIEQVTSLVIVKDVMMSDENIHMRENHTMVIHLYILWRGNFQLPYINLDGTVPNCPT